MPSSSSPYNEAGDLLNKVLTQRVSLKTASFSKANKSVCSKSAYAQVSNTLLYKSTIDTILNHNNGKLKKLIDYESIHNKALIYILIYELLFGKFHSIRGGGRLKRIIMQQAPLFQSTKDELIQSSSKSMITLPTVIRFPRYVRINTLRATVEEVVSNLKNDLQTIHPSDDVHSHIYLDLHVPNLLVLSPDCSLDWTHHPLVSSGKVVLQDKSSCFSALALIYGGCHSHSQETPLGDFIDACAAPGNKTTHLAALVAQIHQKSIHKGTNTGRRQSRIFAFDRSSERIQILQQRIAQMQSSTEGVFESKIVEMIPQQQDFLLVDPGNPMLKHVKSILVDPSCSGSGIINSPDRIMDGKCIERIQALSNFQLLALKHAMSFPQVLRVVYSTCSIYDEENEQVVSCALDEVNRNIQDENMKWVLVLPYALRHWKRRGKASVLGITEEQAQALIRVDGTEGDETNGFFVSYLERRFLALANKDMDDSPIVLPEYVHGWYQGQFSTKREKEDESSGTYKNHEKSARKRQKKLEWKRKQKLQRRERLQRHGT